MAVVDLWQRKDKTRTDRYGKHPRWQARWRVNGVQRKRNFLVKAEAEDFVARRRILPDGAVSSRTVGEQYQWWIGGKRALAAGTVAGYEMKWRRHVSPVWADRLLGSIEHSEVVQWVGGLASKASPTVARKSLQVLAGVTALAVRDRVLQADPCAGVTVSAGQKRSGRFLTGREVAQVAQLMGPDAVVVRLLAFTGIRWGEMAGLRVGDLSRGRLTVARSVTEHGGRLVVVEQTKTKKVRRVGVPPGLLAELTRLAEGRDSEEPLLPAARGGVRRYSRFYHRWLLSVRLAFPGLRPHDLRHTAASLLIEAGADIKVVQASLGHASGVMTADLYGHVRDSRIDEVAELMAKFERPESALG